MDTNLRAYVKVYKNAIPDEVCNQTVLYLQDANWKQEFFHKWTPEGGLEYAPPAEYLNNCHDIMPNNEQLLGLVWKSLEQYFIKDFNFPWCNNWTGFTKPKYNRYAKTHGMQLHCDHIHNVFDGQIKGIPVLSALMLLNDGFEGGEFIMFEDEVIPLEKGDIVLFPSNFLFPHKVTNITSGIRYTAICWTF